jgi:hypothetical protein
MLIKVFNQKEIVKIVNKSPRKSIVKLGTTDPLK